MLMIKKGRRQIAVIMLEFVPAIARDGDIVGAMQCVVDGCEERAPIRYRSAAGTDVEAFGEQTAVFLLTHECDPNRHPGRSGIRSLNHAATSTPTRPS